MSHGSLRIFHSASDVPRESSSARRAIIDASDGAELGFSLKNDLSLKEIFMVSPGMDGYFTLWDKLLAPEDNKLLVVPGCPMRTTKLGEYMTYEKAQNLINVRGRIVSFVKWLRLRGYEEIDILVSRVPTALHLSMMQVKE